MMDTSPSSRSIYSRIKVCIPILLLTYLLIECFASLVAERPPYQTLEAPSMNTTTALVAKITAILLFLSECYDKLGGFLNPLSQSTAASIAEAWHWVTSTILLHLPVPSRQISMLYATAKDILTPLYQASLDVLADWSSTLAESCRAASSSVKAGFGSILDEAHQQVKPGMSTFVPLLHRVLATITVQLIALEKFTNDTVLTVLNVFPQPELSVDWATFPAKNNMTANNPSACGVFEWSATTIRDALSAVAGKTCNDFTSVPGFTFWTAPIIQDTLATIMNTDQDEFFPASEQAAGNISLSSSVMLTLSKTCGEVASVARLHAAEQAHWAYKVFDSTQDSPKNVPTDLLNGFLTTAAFVALVALLADPRGSRILRTLFLFLVSIVFPLDAVKTSIYDMRDRMKFEDVEALIIQRDKYSPPLLIRFYGDSTKNWFNVVLYDVVSFVREVSPLVAVATSSMIRHVPRLAKQLTKQLLYSSLGLIVLLLRGSKATFRNSKFRASVPKCIVCLCFLTVYLMREWLTTLAISTSNKLFQFLSTVHLWSKNYLIAGMVFAADYPVWPVCFVLGFLVMILVSLPLIFRASLNRIITAAKHLAKRSVGALLRAITLPCPPKPCLSIRFHGFMISTTKRRNLTDVADVFISFITLIPFLGFGFWYQAYLLVMAIRCVERLASVSLFAKVSLAQPVLY